MTSQTDDVANRQQVVRCKIAALPTAVPPPQRIATTAHDGRERNWRLTVNNMVIRKSARRTWRGENRWWYWWGFGVGDGDDDADVDVDILDSGLTSLRLPPSLSEPHDPPYPMQPYATKPLQFRNLTKSQYYPLQIPNGRRQGRRHGKGNGMSGPPYDIQRITYDGYDVQRTTVQHGHTRWVSM